jgi:hypothetical protein
MAERRKLNLFKSRGKYLYKIASKPILKGKDVNGHRVIVREPAGKQLVHSSHIVIMQLDRNEELKAMNDYKRNVTKSPENAKAFLKRIGAFDIK